MANFMNKRVVFFSFLFLFFKKKVKPNMNLWFFGIICFFRRFLLNIDHDAIMIAVNSSMRHTSIYRDTHHTLFIRTET